MSWADPPRGWARTCRRILARDGGICWLCGAAGATSVDHVVPRIHGGSHHDANLRAAHVVCNSRKGAHPRPPVERPAVVPLPRARRSRWS